MLYVDHDKNTLLGKSLWSLFATNHLCQIWETGVDCLFLSHPLHSNACEYLLSIPVSSVTGSHNLLAYVSSFPL